MFVDEEGNKYLTLEETLETLGMKYPTFRKWFAGARGRFNPQVEPFKRERYRERYYREEDVQRMLKELNKIYPVGKRG
jgi:predicted site-specific integrase-resolvase